MPAHNSGLWELVREHDSRLGRITQIATDLVRLLSITSQRHRSTGRSILEASRHCKAIPRNSLFFNRGHPAGRPRTRGDCGRNLSTAGHVCDDRSHRGDSPHRAAAPGRHVCRLIAFASRLALPAAASAFGNAGEGALRAGSRSRREPALAGKGRPSYDGGRPIETNGSPGRKDIKQKTALDVREDRWGLFLSPGEAGS